MRFLSDDSDAPQKLYNFAAENKPDYLEITFGGITAIKKLVVKIQGEKLIFKMIKGDEYKFAQFLSHKNTQSFLIFKDKNCVWQEGYSYELNKEDGNMDMLGGNLYYFALMLSDYICHPRDVWTRIKDYLLFTAHNSQSEPFIKEILEISKQYEIASLSRMVKASLIEEPWDCHKQTKSFPRG